MRESETERYRETKKMQRLNTMWCPESEHFKDFHIKTGEIRMSVVQLVVLYTT